MKKILIATLVCLAASCSQTNEDLFYRIVNENFLAFTDTVAYRYGQFYPPPDDTTSYYISEKELPVFVNRTLENSKPVTEALLLEIEENKLTDYKELAASEKKVSLTSIDLSRIANVGKYILVPKKQDNMVGEISFSQPYISPDKAIILMSISSSPKSGRLTAFFLKKTDKKWVLKHTVILERW